MRTVYFPLVLTFSFVVILGLVLPVLAQSDSASAALSTSYDLTWSTIDGGGGTSSGGAYSLSGTIGQPDAGTLSGGAYSLLGGFWGGGEFFRLVLPMILKNP